MSRLMSLLLHPAGSPLGYLSPCGRFEWNSKWFGKGFGDGRLVIPSHDSALNLFPMLTRGSTA